MKASGAIDCTDKNKKGFRILKIKQYLVFGLVFALVKNIDVSTQAWGEYFQKYSNTSMNTFP